MAEACSICLEDKRGRRLAACSPCVHTFCVDCIKQLTRHSGNDPRCPECRAAIRSTLKIYLSSPTTQTTNTTPGRQHTIFNVTSILCLLFILLLLLWNDYKAPDGFIRVFLQPSIRSAIDVLSPVYVRGAHVVSLLAATRLYAWLASLVAGTVSVLTSSACFVWEWVSLAAISVASWVTLPLSWLVGWTSFLAMSVVSWVTWLLTWLVGWTVFLVMSVVSGLTWLLTWLVGWASFLVMGVVTAVTGALCWLYGWLVYVVVFVASEAAACAVWLYSWVALSVTTVASVISSCVCWLFDWLVYVVTWVVSRVFCRDWLAAGLVVATCAVCWLTCDLTGRPGVHVVEGESL